MLKMKKSMMIIVTLLVICLLAVMSVRVSATGTTDDPLNLDITTGDEPTQTNEQPANEPANEAPTNTGVVTPDTNTDANEAVNANTNGSLPQTGVTEDITVMFFIIVCAISAIYAYKKIRDYRM